MSFIFALEVQLPQNQDDISEKFLQLEEEFLIFSKNLEYDFSNQKIILYNLDFKDHENISFHDYLEEGRVLKKFLLENNFANEGNYKSFFKLIKIEEKSNEYNSVEQLDSLIAKVDQNDPKLVEVLQKIEQLKKK